ncbi:MAG: phosphatase PAP2 family protein [Eubacterium sp.]|nr:phosphatase PAP2 family protein [Eubacterium sp.]
MIEWLDAAVMNFVSSIHNDTLTVIMKVLTDIVGSVGWIWVIIALTLICFKKTRPVGLTMALAMLLGLIIGNGVLKNLIARPRPCWRNEDILLLAKVPTDYSFPSGHTMVSFEAATSIFLANKKWGIPALILASAIGFSRIYLGVHYVTDVLAGVVIGVLLAVLAKKVIQFLMKKRSEA